MEEIIKQGLNKQKLYNYNGIKINYIYRELDELPEQKYLQRILINEQKHLKSNDIDMLVFVVSLTSSNQTYQYQIMNNCIKEIISNKVLSIEKDIMPLIETKCLLPIDIKEKIEIIINNLTKEQKTIATMESCTGGQLASEITNISGASEVLHESYISYSNEAKIKFGVEEQVIKKYTVYSAETAIAMSKAVKKLAKAEIGIGITGQLGRIDPNNSGCTNNTVWYCISQKGKEFVCKLIISENLTRCEMKDIIVKEIIDTLILVLH